MILASRNLDFSQELKLRYFKQFEGKSKNIHKFLEKICTI